MRSFGKEEGHYESSVLLAFKCNFDANIPPTILSDRIALCPGQSVNLNDFVDQDYDHELVSLEWLDSNYDVVVDPTHITEAGKYYVMYISNEVGCISQSVPVEVVIDQLACETCEKEPIINENNKKTTVLISSLSRNDLDNLETNKNGDLVLESKDKSLIIPRLENTGVVAKPVEGMVIYDKSSSCIKLYDGSKWSNCISQYCLPYEGETKIK